MLKFCWNTWLMAEEFQTLLELCPPEWRIEELGRWYHAGDRVAIGTRQAVDFDIYAESKDEVARFWEWFNNYLDGLPEAAIADREKKWRQIMARHE